MVDARYILVSDTGETTAITGDMLVGRSTQCDMTIANNEVSRKHARIFETDQGISLTDLGSSNGTFVQGKRISDIHHLSNGDVVRFGPCAFTVVCDSVNLDETTISFAADKTLAEKSVSEAGQPVEPQAGEAEQDVARAQVERPRESPSESKQSEPDGKRGSIEVMPRNQDLPPVWFNNDVSDTQSLSEEDIKKMDSIQSECALELTVMESDIDAPTLLIVSGADAGLPYKLRNFEDLSFWTIGRGSESQEVSITINDNSVSEFHAKLVYNEGRWKIVDQMSTNNTYVNGQPYNSAFLSSRDSIRFGSVNAIFLLPGKAQVEPEEDAPTPGSLDRLKKLFKKKGSSAD